MRHDGVGVRALQRDDDGLRRLPSPVFGDRPITGQGPHIDPSYPIQRNRGSGRQRDRNAADVFGRHRRPDNPDD